MTDKSLILVIILLLLGVVAIFSVQASNVEAIKKISIATEIKSESQDIEAMSSLTGPDVK